MSHIRREMRQDQMIMVDMQLEKNKDTRTKPQVTLLFKSQGEKEVPEIKTAKEQLVKWKWHILKSKRRKCFKEKGVIICVKFR